jgi:glycosyltransferase EpsD
MGVGFARLNPLEAGVREQLRREWGFGPESFLLVYAAEFSSRKSQSVLLHTLVQLPKRVGLLLPGQGVLRDECIALAERLGLKDRVVFPGQVSDMAPWYAAADLISHCETGLLYPYGNAGACAACVRALLDDPAKAARLGSAAQKSVLRYSLPEVLPQIMEHYDRLVPLALETAGV